MNAPPTPQAGGVIAPLPHDTREDQASRLASFLEQSPVPATGKEIEAACDVGCVTKLVSVMHKEMGYVFSFGWRWVSSAHGCKRLRLRTYSLVSRPAGGNQLDLFKS